MQRFVQLETVLRRAPLGLRFRDLAHGAPVTDGLLVTARPLGATGPGRTAVRSPISGIYGFRTLPGLYGYTSGEQPATDWCSPPAGSPPADLTDLEALRALLEAESDGAPANFVVAVVDQQGRFLPQTLRLCLPRTRLVAAPLFSTPARPAPPGLAVLRGELRTRLDDNPAGWALVTASPDGVSSAVAISDARGMFMLLLPYPPPLTPPIGSPGGISEPAWNLTIQVFYQPGQQHFVPGFDPPDIRSILGQAAATVYDVAGPTGGGPTLQRTVRFGRPLVVTTHGQSRLLIDPAA